MICTAVKYLSEPDAHANARYRPEGKSTEKCVRLSSSFPSRSAIEKVESQSEYEGLQFF